MDSNGNITIGDVKSIACNCVNKFGSGMHPVADNDSLDFFKRDYVLTCMQTAHDAFKRREQFSQANKVLAARELYAKLRLS